MEKIAARDLSAWMVEQRITFAPAAQIAGWLGCQPEEVPHRLRGARRSGEMVCVTTGGWAPAAGGRVQVDSFLDEMMGHLGLDYYVGHLTAAAMYGVSHRAAQGVVAVTPSALKARTVGRGWLRFVRKPNTADYPTRTLRLRTAAGAEFSLVVSSPETTLLDLIDHPRRRGDRVYLNAVAQMIDWFEIDPAANGGAGSVRRCPYSTWTPT